MRGEEKTTTKTKSHKVTSVAFNFASTGEVAPTSCLQVHAGWLHCKSLLDRDVAVWTKGCAHTGIQPQHTKVAVEDVPGKVNYMILGQAPSGNASLNSTAPRRRHLQVHISAPAPPISHRIVIYTAPTARPAVTHNRDLYCSADIITKRISGPSRVRNRLSTIYSCLCALRVQTRVSSNRQGAIEKVI